MTPRDPATVTDILNAARRIEEATAALDQERFNRDWLVHSAVIRQLEIIGEATKRLSSDYREAHPETPWKQMAGLRDVLIHGYDTIDLEMVWIVAREAIPELIRQLTPE
ncbi:HepT-like ribonuclease domain-containing protein [Endothiovibrio diazotrophicus]